MFKTLLSSESRRRSVDFDDIVHYVVKKPLGVHLALASKGITVKTKH
ncbi:hypothetical protein DBT_2386 [Dissulfuribacter thermophilus]|uniref:Uncharacterized protein n=1 Tax=Dissulfuribacter thermophilus TaxID=1156395 RepID=A0A1B9F333_9BACT|nr:hypothetical protein [Dissulfuribacter thermophilus]OCC14244.1 hypothetical protein DBT_2386 [Dissulfuribacter thermophilus]